MADEEILVLQAIYCMPGEVQVICEANGTKQISLNLQDGCEKGQFKPQATVVFNIPSTYPCVTPDILLFSKNIDCENIQHIQHKLCFLAEKCIGYPMLMNLIELLQEEISALPLLSGGMECHEPKTYSRSLAKKDYEKSGNETNCQPEAIPTILLHIDHMRAKSKYIKTIEKWVRELELTGRLVFCNRLILLVLQGESSCLKEYITKHKTAVIDVDSKGHPCKEKMMSVLFNKQLASQTSFADFQVVEYSCLEDLRQAFHKYSIHDLFENYVLGIKGLKLS